MKQRHFRPRLRYTKGPLGLGYEAQCPSRSFQWNSHRYCVGFAVRKKINLVASRKALDAEINAIEKETTVFRRLGAQCTVVGKAVVSPLGDFLKCGEIAVAKIAFLSLRKRSRQTTIETSRHVRQEGSRSENESAAKLQPKILRNCSSSCD